MSGGGQKEIPRDTVKAHGRPAGIDWLASTKSDDRSSHVFRSVISSETRNAIPSNVELSMNDVFHFFIIVCRGNVVQKFH